MLTLEVNLSGVRVVMVVIVHLTPMKIVKMAGRQCIAKIAAIISRPSDDELGAMMSEIYTDETLLKIINFELGDISQLTDNALVSTYRMTSETVALLNTKVIAYPYNQRAILALAKRATLRYEIEIELLRRLCAINHT